MSPARAASPVDFNESGAIYRPGNGHVIEYRRVAGIYYHVNTPDAVVHVLELARLHRQRIRLYYGDSQTGRDWLEELDVEGMIDTSTGPLKVPLLLYNRRSVGGSALLDHCIVKIKRSAGGGVLYQHPNYHTGTLTIRDTGPDDAVGDRTYAYTVDRNGQTHARFKSLAAARRYVKRMTA